MCDPVSITAAAGLAVSSAAAGVSYYGQRENAQNQAAYGAKMYNATAKAAGANERNQFSQTGLRAIQETQSAEQQAQQTQIASAEAKGRFNASFDGTQGNSLDEILADFDRIEAMNHNTQGQNLTMVNQQLGQQQQSIYAENQSRISGAVPAPVAMPSAAASALQIAGAAVQSYNSYQQTQFNQSVLKKVKAT